MAPKANVLDAAAAIGSASDNLAPYYSKKAESSNPKEREAAMLFSIAEGHLNQDEDYVEALRATSEALVLWRDLKDTVAVADTLRLSIHAYKVKAESLRYTEGSETQTAVKEALDEAERIASEELAKFRAGNDQRSIGTMLLSLAEVNHSKRGLDKQEQAFLAAIEARGIFREVKELKLEAGACYALTNVYIQKMQVQEAVQVGNEALAIFRELADKKSEAKCLHVLAIAYLMDDMFQDAIESAKGALKIFRDMASLKLVAFELYNIATWFLNRDKPKEALPYAREALQIFEELNYSKGWQAASLALLVQSHVDSGDSQQGVILGKQGLQKFQDSGDLRGKVFALDAIAHAQLCRDEQDEALTAVESGLQACRDLGDRRWESQMLRTLCAVHSQSRDWDKAVQAVTDAQVLCQELGDRAEEADICSTLARVHIAQQDFESAMVSAEAQRSVFKETGERTKEAFAVLLIASIRGMKAELSAAMAEANEALEMFQDLGHRSGEGSTLQLIAEVNLSKEDFSAGLAAAQQMLDIFAEKDNPKMQAQALLATAKLRLAEDTVPEEGLKAANAALALVKRTEDKRLQVEVLNLVAQAHLGICAKEASSAKDMAQAMRKGGDKALKVAQEALKVARKVNDKPLIAASIYMVGTSQMVCQRSDAALKAADDAAEVFRNVGDKAGDVACTVLRAEVQTMNGNDDKAMDLANKALAAAKACGDEMGEWRAYTVLQRLQQKQGVPVATATASAAGPAVADAPAVEEKPGMDPAVCEKMVMNIVASSIGSDDDVALDSPLMDSGMDSLSSVAFRNDLQRAVGFNLSAALIFDYPTPRLIVDHLVEASRGR